MSKFNVDDLIEQGLVSRKTYHEGLMNGLSVFKYKKKVFFDKLWEIDSRLLECRGIVVDARDNIVSHPFTKIFNLGEKYGDVGAPDIPLDTVVEVSEKMNGFLGVAVNYEDHLLVSTTGSLDSEFVELAKKQIGNVKLSPMCTFMFEICDETDPHIIYQEPGAYLIGMREMSTGKMFSEDDLDKFAVLYGFKRPRHGKVNYGVVLDAVKDVKHEGFIIRDIQTHDLLLKIKSPHYLAKKFLMRMGKAKVSDMYDNQEGFKHTLDEEFYSLVDYITKNIDIDIWCKYNDQQRRDVIEKFIYQQRG